MRKLAEIIAGVIVDERDVGREIQPVIMYIQIRKYGALIENSRTAFSKNLKELTTFS